MLRTDTVADCPPGTRNRIDIQVRTSIVATTSKYIQKMKMKVETLEHGVRFLETDDAVNRESFSYAAENQKYQPRFSLDVEQMTRKYCLYKIVFLKDRSVSGGSYI